MAHKTLAIEALNDAVPGTTAARLIHGDTASIVVPGSARLSIDCRVPSLEEQARVTAGIEAAAARTFVPDTRASLTGGFHRPPMEASARTLAYVERMQAIAARSGFPLGAASTGGASDGNLTAAAGTPTLDGLGAHGARAHSPEEYVELPSLEAKCRVLAAFLADLGEATPA